MARLVTTAGRIVNIASTNSFRPQREQPAHGGVEARRPGLTRSAALDSRAGPHHRICPGTIDTPMLRSAMQRRGRDPRTPTPQPVGRFGTPDETPRAACGCVDAVSFTLATPSPSRRYAR
jgi:NAD(P)-dependent dehydrogenase (short-subunit alcohol dehydrogenase family)